MAELYEKYYKKKKIRQINVMQHKSPPLKAYSSFKTLIKQRQYDLEWQ